MTSVRGQGTVAVSTTVRDADLLGNDRADTAADMGRLRQSDSVTNTAGLCSKFDGTGTPSCWIFRKYGSCNTRVVANHDGYGGTALNTMTWDKEGVLKDEVPSGLTMTHEILQLLLVPHNSGLITLEHVAVWHYTVGLVFFSALSQLARWGG